MSSQVNASLYATERMALDVLRREMQKYEETQALSGSFVALLKNTHEMLMKGAKQRVGLDLGSKSPREVLVELQQLVVEFQQLVEQENELAAQDQLQ
jgi:hypothetical protein